MKPKEILDEYYPDESFLVMDGMDDAFLGISVKCRRTVYSEEKIIETLINDGMTYEEAVDFYGFNIAHAYVGEHTPIIIQKLPEE